MLLSA